MEYINISDYRQPNVVSDDLLSIFYCNNKGLPKETIPMPHFFSYTNVIMRYGPLHFTT